jgi:hypothetical protein
MVQRSSYISIIDRVLFDKKSIFGVCNMVITRVLLVLKIPKKMEVYSQIESKLFINYTFEMFSTFSKKRGDVW